MKKTYVTVGAFVVVAVLPNVPGDVHPHAATSNTVLFDREIVRLLDEHCVMCHAGSASLPLETYEQVWLARRQIHDAVLARTMPPWAAVPGYGDFVNANGLTLRETRFIVSWVEGLGPRNDGEVFLNVQGADARAEIRAGIDVDVWRIGAPDVVVPVPQQAAVAEGSDEDGAAGGLRIVRSVVETGLDTAADLSALEYHAGERQRLRAVVFSLEASGQWLATWTPWHGSREIPGDAAIRLPRGARVVADFYVGDGSGGLDAGELGLRLASAARSAGVADIVLDATSAATDAAGSRRSEARHSLTGDTTVLALWPTLPADTESIEVRVREPGGRISVLLAVMDPSPGWPTSYILDEPSLLRRGSELRFIVYRSATGVNAAASRARLVLSGFDPGARP